MIEINRGPSDYIYHKGHIRPSLIIYNVQSPFIAQYLIYSNSSSIIYIHKPIIQYCKIEIWHNINILAQQ